MIKYMIAGFLTLSTFLIPNTDCLGADYVIDPETKMSFPSTISFSCNDQNYQLNLTGTRARRKFYMNIYAIAHYMENPPAFDDKNIYNEILLSQSAKQFSIIWMYGINAKQVREGFLDTFKKELSTKEFLAVNNEIEQFLAIFQKDVKVNDQHIMRWLPDSTVEIYVNGDRMVSIANAEFSIALWRLWIGDQSTDDRNKLVSLLEDQG